MTIQAFISARGNVNIPHHSEIHQEKKTGGAAEERSRCQTLHRDRAHVNFQSKSQRMLTANADGVAADGGGTYGCRLVFDDFDGYR